VRLRHGWAYIALILGAALFMAPIYAMVASALRPAGEQALSNAWDWPGQPTTENLRAAVADPNFNIGRLFLNTLQIAVLGTLGTVATASMAAYAFARLQFPFRDRLFLALLATMMLPGIITVIPTYALFAKIGWVNTNLPLWVPAWFGGSAFFVFLLRQFFLGLPRELDEAAKLDGATHALIFWRIVMPLSGPALATVAVFSFVGSWTDFLGPLIYLSDRDRMTIELGLRALQVQQTGQPNVIMAATLIALIPIAVIFLLGQKYFVRGISMTGGK